MKHTKSMIYTPSTEATELFMYVTNNSYLYHYHTKSIIENLKKKAVKGIYDTNKAIDLYYYLATAGSDKYFKDFGYKFSVTDRYTVAVDLENYYKDDEVFYELNNK